MPEVVKKPSKISLLTASFSGMKEALLLIDIQSDYFPGGRMELAGMEDAAKKAVSLIKAFRITGKPIFFVRHLSVRPGATFFIPGTPGADIHASIQPLPEETVIEKHFPNSFFQTELLLRLKEADVTNLVVCGAMSHMCIDTTVRAAKELGFTSTLIADACVTRDLKLENKLLPACTVHAVFMAALDGMFATVMTAEEYLS
ncbi:cysteine hydrolase family protein [Methanosarcina sp.]|uniref:cysteine hydrolase family protein n=1 Tax=Methanosarcina sp. TaxID=2213 RepID=UPI002AB9A563|nr:cysteine hydrolase family protein [Methanosarcina sp.]MDY9924844.1 cysteine hydrolase family protein [Methanosarcina sp.]